MLGAEEAFALHAYTPGHQVKFRAALIAIGCHHRARENPNRSKHVRRLELREPGYGFLLPLSGLTRATVHTTIDAQPLWPGGLYCGGVSEP